MSSSDAAPALTRRQLLRRAGAVGGALVWTAPVVQSLSGPAVAASASAVDVEGVKKTAGRPGAGDQGIEVLGTKLPSTGSVAGDAVALGVGGLAVGATLRAAHGRRAADDQPEDCPA